MSAAFALCQGHTNAHHNVMEESAGRRKEGGGGGVGEGGEETI